MANEMPNAETYTGLSRKVLQYCEGFRQLAEKIRQKQFCEKDWALMEEFVDVHSFKRSGVFLSNKLEIANWEQYKKLISQYGGTAWEGTLRRITEVPGLVFLELEERNSRDGVTDIANTLTVYEFSDASKLIKLDVYVTHVGEK